MRTKAARHARATGDACAHPAIGTHCGVVNSAPRIVPPVGAFCRPLPMHVLKGILLKLASALLFAVMSALIRGFGDAVPVGQVVFFRSAFAIVPVVLIYAARRELATAVRTGRPFGHVGRGIISVFGMFLSFAALVRLPLVDATAISFASPLITVALAAAILKERVRVYRWSAVVIGFLGVVVMLIPYFDVGRAAAAGPAIGALFAISAAFCNAGTVIQTRRLTDSETTSAIVFYFSLFCALAGLLTLPFAWHPPTGAELIELMAIGVLGGISHILLTESYRFAPASLLAPFDYTAMVWAFVLGYAMFGETPTALVFLGALIIAAAGLFVIWRERRLGIERARARAKARTPAPG
jgi:drug/metabolite transporter (DMT)-like permease